MSVIFKFEDNRFFDCIFSIKLNWLCCMSSWNKYNESWWRMNHGTSSEKVIQLIKCTSIDNFSISSIDLFIRSQIVYNEDFDVNCKIEKSLDISSQLDVQINSLIALHSNKTNCRKNYFIWSIYCGKRVVYSTRTLHQWWIIIVS